MFINEALEYLRNNWIEVTGMVLSILGVWLTAIEKIINWPISIVSCVIYGYVFFNDGIYADSYLQIFFIVFSFYGWYLWSTGKNKKEDKLVVGRTPLKAWLILTGLAIPAACLLAWILIKHTNSTVPIPDAITTVLSLVATWQAARKYIENWLVWFVADTIYIVEYLVKGLDATAVLYFIFTILALYGYWEWRKIMRKLSALQL